MWGYDWIDFVKFFSLSQNFNFKILLNIMKETKAGKTVGIFRKDNFPGEFCESWEAALRDAGFEKVDISAAMAYVMAPKEETEIATVKKTCSVSIDVFNSYLEDQIREIISADLYQLTSISLFSIQ